MKKHIIALSAITALSTSLFGAKLTHDDLKAQIDMLKAQLAALESKIEANSAEKNITQLDEKRIVKLEKKVAKNSKKINKVKAHGAGDNLKFDVDFRTSVDSISYKLKDGSTVKNNSLLTNRLWLNGKYAPTDNVSFYARLSYMKAYGDGANGNQRTNGTNANANFDWVTNENANEDNTLNVKQAFWLYKNDSFFGNEDIAWTASVGRRPSTDGLLANFREDQQRQSALAHTVNVEFDGASARFNLDKLTGVEGMWVKFCAGRGLTNALPRFDSSGTDYAVDTTQTKNVDMAGLIFVPYDDGQYSIHTNYSKAWNMIGYADATDVGAGKTQGQFYNWGDMEFMTAGLVVDGIGNEINDYLDNSKFFISFAQSITHPKNGERMLGSSKSEKGHSIWAGINVPDGFSNGRFGLEWNKGSKYWRSMTYGEDTMVGSKIAARGTAWEAYYNKELTKALSASIRFTKIKYDYTGSNAFFGSNGAPIDMASASDSAVQEATDIRAYIRYRF